MKETNAEHRMNRVAYGSACQPCLTTNHVSGILSQKSEARLELAGLLGIIAVEVKAETAAAAAPD